MPRPARRRPAFWSALAFAAGIAAADRVAPPLEVWLAAAGGLALAAVALAVARRRRSPRAATACLLALLAACGGLRYHQHTRLFPADHVAIAGPFGERGVLCGRVDEEPEVREGDPGDGHRLRFALRAESWQPEAGGPARPLAGLVLVSLHGFTPAVDDGDRLWLRCRLTRPQPARNPGAFDQRRFLALQGLHATASLYREADLVARQELPAPWLRQVVIAPVRQAARQALRANLSGAPAGLLLGILLGEKHAIPGELAADFRDTGLTHALVISGLNVALVAMVFFTGFRLCRAPPRVAHLATVAALVVYALVTDLQAPVVRATIMAAVLLAGRAAGRRGEVYNSLGLSALLILALWPASLLTLSFQLSFGATLAIVGLHGPLLSLVPRSWADEERFVGKWVVSPTCVTLAAQIGTGPLLAYSFQQFAPVSLVANLAVVPLLGLATALGLLAALAGPWLAAAGTVLNGANYLVLVGAIDLVSAFAEVPLASVTTPQPGPAFVLFAAAGAVLLAHSPTSRRARRALALLLLAWANLAVWGHLLRSRDLEVVFLDVDQGDGAFLRFPNGRTMVVDAGQRSQRIDFGERVVVPYLRHRSARRVDVVVATHPHADHIGGLVHLLETVAVSHFVDSGQAYDSWTARRLRQLIEEKGITYHRVAAGDSLTGLGGVGALVLHPTQEYVAADGASPHGLNDGSVVIRLDFGGTRLLLTGDIERETDAALLRWGEGLRADLLKAAHHGSRTSSTPAFVEAVDPVLCVVSVGAFNEFGHPAPEVMARFRERGTDLYRTDQCGAVTVRVGPGGRRAVRAAVEESCRP